MTIDPLAEIVTMLKPAARFSKSVEAAGQWRVQREASGEPFYCAILEGRCRVCFSGSDPLTLHAGDFVLAPAMRDLIIESIDAPHSLPAVLPLEVSAGHFQVGDRTGPDRLRMRVGHCSFAAPDAPLLVSLLPDVVLVRDHPRLATLMQLVDEETSGRQAARDIVLERLLEVLLIEALRSGTESTSVPGVGRGMGDERLAAVLRAIHAHPDRNWTVVDLAKEAALSRSAFFARFSRIVGLPPMEYLLAWRMVLAKQMLSERSLGIDTIAERVGYGSASTFSTAFSRYVGMPPARFGRMAG